MGYSQRIERMFAADRGGEEREDVDQRIDDAYNHPDNSRETLRAVGENGGNSGGPSRPFRPVGRGYDSSPESFRAGIVNFNGRAAKFA